MTEDGKPAMNLRRKYSKVIKRMPNAYAGLYKYFNDLDEDCSGFLEKNEIHGITYFFKALNYITHRYLQISQGGNHLSIDNV